MKSDDFEKELEELFRSAGLDDPDQVPPSSALTGSKAYISGINGTPMLPTFDFDGFFDYKEEPVSQKIEITCEHLWVNVGFNSIKNVCKKCDKEEN